jgi:hypothetical protein
MLTYEREEYKEEGGREGGRDGWVGRLEMGERRRGKGESQLRVV